MKHILLILLFGITWMLQAQTPRFYNNSHGLVSTRINRLSFDKEDFLWVSTERGLCRFNGNDFKVFTADRTSPKSLHENNVSCMFEDAKGRHWVGAKDGFYYFCRTENKFVYHDLSLIEGEHVTVSDIIAMPGDDSRLIACSYGFGMYVFDADHAVLDTLRTNQLMRGKDSHLHAERMFADVQGRLWVLLHKGIMVLDLQTDDYVMLQGDSDCDLKSLSFMAIASTADGKYIYLGAIDGTLVKVDTETLRYKQIKMPYRSAIMSLLYDNARSELLIGTEGDGVFRMDSNGNVTPMLFERTGIDIASAKVHDMAYDGQGNLWLSVFQRGLVVVPAGDPFFSYLMVSDTRNGANLGCVSSFEYQPGRICVAGIDGGGLMVRSLVNKRQIIFNKDNSVLRSNSVLSLAPDGNGGTYIATYNGGVYHLENAKNALENGTRLELKEIPELREFADIRLMTIFCDTVDNNLYIGSHGRGVYRFDLNTRTLQQYEASVFNPWIVSLKMDSQKRLWVGTENGVGMIDLGNSVIRNVSGPELVRTYDIEECAGEIWMATDQGLVKYDSASDELHVVRRDGGDNGEELTALTSVADTILWYTSTNGLFSYRIKNSEFMSYNNQVIRSVGNFHYGACKLWYNGKITFGGDNGFVIMEPDILNSVGHKVAPIYFNQLRLNNERVDYNPDSEENCLDGALWHATRLTLKPEDNSFVITFSVKDYNDPAGLVYAYQMEGLDDEWHILKDNPRASFVHLPSGEYKLNVMAAHTYEELCVPGRGVSRSLEVVVLKPWYLAWWMMCLYVFMVIGVIAIVTHQILQRIDERRKMLKAEQEQQIQTAKLRMFTAMTHEYLAPASLLLSTMKRLMSLKTDHVTSSIYEIMHRNVMRILMLTDQQLDLRKIDNGQMHLRMKSINLHSFLMEQMMYYKNLDGSLGLTVSLNSEDEDLEIWADPNELDKIVMNLLSNAYKYTPSGGNIEVSVKKLPNVGKLNVKGVKEVVNIEIFNSGSHISHEDIDHIFERFYKGKNSKGEDNGSGIGLNVAYELTQYHHGAISARNENASKEGDRQGVVFSLILPVGDAHLTVEEKAPVTMPAVGGDEASENEQPVITVQQDMAPDPYQNTQVTPKFDAEAERKTLQKYSLEIEGSQINLESSDEKLLNRIMKAINKNLGDSDFGVEELSKEVGLSRVHLNRKLKDLLDTSPSALIKNVRLRHATYLLVKNDVSVAEVAYSVGFSSPSYFTTNFTQFFGITPKDFIATYAADPDEDRLQKFLNGAAGKPSKL